jgi:hypothetical protein
MDPPRTYTVITNSKNFSSCWISDYEVTAFLVDATNDKWRLF